MSALTIICPDCSKPSCQDHRMPSCPLTHRPQYLGSTYCAFRTCGYFAYQEIPIGVLLASLCDTHASISDRLSTHSLLPERCR